MKNPFYSPCIAVIAAFLMMGADFRKDADASVKPFRKHCSGYTVIEANLGVNCYGDTVRLTRRYGYYEIVESSAEIASTSH